MLQEAKRLPNATSCATQRRQHFAMAQQALLRGLPPVCSCSRSFLSCSRLTRSPVIKVRPCARPFDVLQLLLCSPGETTSATIEALCRHRTLLVLALSSAHAAGECQAHSQYKVLHQLHKQVSHCMLQLQSVPLMSSLPG